MIFLPDYIKLSLNSSKIRKCAILEDSTFQNSLLLNTQSKPNDKISCFFEDTYIRKLKYFSIRLQKIVLK